MGARSAERGRVHEPAVRPQLVEAALEGRTACLMQNHGHVGYAHDLDTAIESALLVEWACTVYWRARAIGEPVALTGEQMQEVLEQVVQLGYGKPNG